MNIETQIHLNKFKPRPYQMNLATIFEEGRYKKIFAIWPRRCLSGESFIIMADGSYKFLKNVQIGDLVASWDGEKFVPDKVINKWETEEKETIHIKSPKQIKLECSWDHVFATVKDSKDTAVKWLPFHEIDQRHFLLTYAGIDTGIVHRPDLAEFIGYMQSDGYISGYQQPKFTNTNMEILKRVEYLAQKLFDIKVIWREKDNGYDLGLSNGTLGGGTFKNPVKELFRASKADKSKKERRLLKDVWSFDRESVLRFFAGLISGDGSINIAKKGFKGDRKDVPPGIEICINCGLAKEYALDIYWLCRKLGMLPQALQLDKESNWKVRLSRSEDVKQLLAFPIIGKEKKQQEVLEFVKDYKHKKEIFQGCHRFSKRYTNGEKKRLYDIKTENNHNFVANGYLVHNSGKDFTIFNLMLRAALRKVGSYFYCLPTFKQARLVIWDAITIHGSRFLDCIPPEIIKRTNTSEMVIELINGSLIRLIGSDTYDTSLVGTNPIMVVFSEYALSDDRAYKYVRPILNANDGTVIILSTPRGHNHFYDLYQIAKHNPEWFCQKLTLNETQHIPLEVIKKEIVSGEISEELAQQEYFTSFDLGVEGSYYGRYIDKMRLENRIAEVPWEPAFPVHCAFDLGMRDSTSIIFFQTIGTVIHIIDYYENSSEGLEHYARYLQDKPYKYGKIFAPHDIQVRELGTGMSRLEKARQLGISFVLAPNLLISDGIEAVRSTLPKCWIDQKKCAHLIKCLENYRREYDAKKKIYHDRPLHDIHSHGADAMRYLCLSLPKTRDGVTPEELDKRYNEAMYGTDSTLPAPFNEPQFQKPYY